MNNTKNTGPTFNNSNVGVFIEGGEFQNFALGNITINNIDLSSEENVKESKLEILNRIKIPNPFGK